MAGPGTTTRGLALYERIVSTIGPVSAGFAPKAAAATTATTASTASTATTSSTASTASTGSLDGRGFRLATAARALRSISAFTDLQTAIAATNAQGRLDPALVEKLLAKL